MQHTGETTALAAGGTNRGREAVTSSPKGGDDVTEATEEKPRSGPRRGKTGTTGAGLRLQKGRTASTEEWLATGGKKIADRCAPVVVVEDALNAMRIIYNRHIIDPERGPRGRSRSGCGSAEGPTIKIKQTTIIREIARSFYSPHVHIKQTTWRSPGGYSSGRSREPRAGQRPAGQRGARRQARNQRSGKSTA